MKIVLGQERLKREWTQEYVAKQLGISRAAFNLIENGKRKPSYDVLVKLLDLFGYTNPRELFEEASEPPNSIK